MNVTTPKHFLITPEVQHAIALSLPIVALESTVITHGLPKPENIQLARNMEAQVRQHAVTPATIAVLDGKIRVGLPDEEIIALAEVDTPLKVSRREFATAILQKASGGTTVAGTMLAAHTAGIRIFATGGIGGVHRDSNWDVSTDLPALADTPMIVICAGAKSILDLPATLEYLETMSVPVIGYQTNQFPAFFSRESGLKISARLDTPSEIAEFAKTHWELGNRSAVLVANPVPMEQAISDHEIAPIIAQANHEAHEQDIHGQALTPFLLSRIKDLSHGKSLQANLALLLNNAKLAAHIAAAYHQGMQQKIA